MAVVPTELRPTDVRKEVRSEGREVEDASEGWRSGMRKTGDNRAEGQRARGLACVQGNAQSRSQGQVTHTLRNRQGRAHEERRGRRPLRGNFFHSLEIFHLPPCATFPPRPLSPSRQRPPLASCLTWVLESAAVSSITHSGRPTCLAQRSSLFCRLVQISPL